MRLDGDLTIAAAADQAARLRAALGGADELVLTLDDAADCDSAGVQLLLALRATLARQGRTLRLAGAGAAVQAALETFGLRALFGLDGGSDATLPPGALP